MGRLSWVVQGHCAAGVTREYMYNTFVKASPDRVWVVQSNIDRFHKYLAESDTPEVH
jgi:hypothetical protein